MRKLFYMGLEPYEGRYTLQLEEWSRRAFERRPLSSGGPEGPAQRAKRATQAKRATSREAARNQYLKLLTRQTKSR